MARKIVEVQASGDAAAASGSAGAPQQPRPNLLPLQTHLSIPLLLPTPTREETEEEGRVLLSTFIDYQVAQEGMEHPEALGDMVYSQTLEGVEAAQAPPSREEVLLAHPVYRRVGRELRDLAERFSYSPERSRVRQEADALDLSTLTRENLNSLMLELFHDGFSRERLVTFFFFCSDLILRALRTSLGACLRMQVVLWVWAFLRDNVCDWVLQRGGWEVVLTSYLPSLVVTAAGVAVCAAAIFYIWKNCELVAEETWVSVQAISERLVAEPLTAVVCRLSAELFRFLRNAFAGDPANSETALSRRKLLQNVDYLIRALMEQRSKEPTDEEATVALRCGLQCFGNLVASWEASRELVWNLTFLWSTPIYPALLSSDDATLRMYASMLLHGCLLKGALLRLFFWSPCTAEVVTCLTQMMADVESEWSLFLLEMFLTHENSPVIFGKLPRQARWVVLDVAVEQVQKKDGQAVHADFLDHLCAFLQREFEDVVAVPHCIDEGKLEPIQISKMLNVLCEASCNENFSQLIEPKQGLLKATLGVLKVVHLLGKSGNNAFTPAPKLDDLVKAEEADSDVDPRRNFKKELVRLVGNMSHHSRANQDLVRQVEGIALLLDVCNLDAKNPYIIQWVVLAIRNLLENNPKNQEVVAGLVNKGIVTDAPQLQELGISLDLLSLTREGMSPGRPE
ncbi:ataxin-10, putative [Ixodes scapularis]|uniref:Ataxin-10 n=1 Tax=Ixodes scapularis TaxID=6945 RepID=B7QGH7_IXOSC|nr:ataxin-10, putative [Ixodes scapularis]|eukprot:XP_002401807.1 ataxin-10, putative [Ixodes scapularis]